MPDTPHGNRGFFQAMMGDGRPLLSFTGLILVLCGGFALFLSATAHDRAGFGAGVCTIGILLFFCVWCAAPSRSLWQVLCISGVVGFGTAIGVHPAIGYTDFIHLAPAYLGALAFAAGFVLTYRPMLQGGSGSSGDKAEPTSNLPRTEQLAVRP